MKRPSAPPAQNDAQCAISQVSQVLQTTCTVLSGELLRRIGPWPRSLGQFFQDEIAMRAGWSGCSGTICSTRETWRRIAASGRPAAGGSDRRYKPAENRVIL